MKTELFRKILYPENLDAFRIRPEKRMMNCMFAEWNMMNVFIDVCVSVIFLSTIVGVFSLFDVSKGL